MTMLLTLNLVPVGSRPNLVIALTTRCRRTGSTPSGKVGSEMNAASSFLMPQMSLDHHKVPHHPSHAELYELPGSHATL